MITTSIQFVTVVSALCFLLASKSVVVAAGQEELLPFQVSVVGELKTSGVTFDDGRPTEGSAKQAVWLGDWNGDGIPEYMVSTKKGGTSMIFYSNAADGTWNATKDWYAPSYSLIALDTRGDARPEYIIKTTKFAKMKNGISQDMYVDYVKDAGKSYTTVLKIPENWDPATEPLQPVQVFDRAVPIIQGCMDVDGDGKKDLLLVHHTENSDYVARYYKGKDDSSDDIPFESTAQWKSTGAGSTMFGDHGNHKARWGDVQIITKNNSVIKRLFAVGSEGENNNVIYWDYDAVTDTFDTDPTILDITSIPRQFNNELHVVSIRALPGAIMLAGKDGAYFLKYDKTNDTYTMIVVPEIEERMAKREGKIEYSDFWCFNSGKNDGTMVFAILQKPVGNKDSTIEWRTFNPSLASNPISNVLAEVTLPPKAQRITVLRTDDSFDPMLDAAQLIVAHNQGATILDVTYP